MYFITYQHTAQLKRRQKKQISVSLNVKFIHVCKIYQDALLPRVTDIVFSTHFPFSDLCSVTSTFVPAE